MQLLQYIFPSSSPSPFFFPIPSFIRASHIMKKNKNSTSAITEPKVHNLRHIMAAALQRWLSAPPVGGFFLHFPHLQGTINHIVLVKMLNKLFQSIKIRPNKKNARLIHKQKFHERNLNKLIVV